jgi:hypothetical protein
VNLRPGGSCPQPELVVTFKVELTVWVQVPLLEFNWIEELYA